MIRKHFIDHTRINKETVEWRGHEVSRIEAFSDAVFAFAVTLLVVSLEVPESFDELTEKTHGFLAFGISFILLFYVWQSQNTFFRRYGLQDARTNALNGALLFVVLFFVYPLKFLYMFITLGNSYEHHGQELKRITPDQIPELMTLYGLGFIGIGILFMLMYMNAIKKAEHLQLTPVELFETKTHIYVYLGFALTGLLSIGMAWLLPREFSGLSGPVYAILGPLSGIIFSRRGKMKRLRFETTEEAVNQ